MLLRKQKTKTNKIANHFQDPYLMHNSAEKVFVVIAAIEESNQMFSCLTKLFFFKLIYLFVAKFCFWDYDEQIKHTKSNQFTCTEQWLPKRFWSSECERKVNLKWETTYYREWDQLVEYFFFKFILVVLYCLNFLEALSWLIFLTTFVLFIK